jgi:MFS family permease
VLANTRFPEGAAAFGVLMSAYGGGSLLGIAMAGILPRPPARRMGTVLGIVWSVLGLGVVALGLIPYTPLAALVTLIMGAANGYVVIIFITWLQTSTQEAMLGRMMSLLMFASAGLLPLSSLLTGALIGVHVVGLFVISGSLMTLLVLLMLRNPSIRSLEVVSNNPDIALEVGD